MRMDNVVRHEAAATAATWPLPVYPMTERVTLSALILMKLADGALNEHWRKG